MAAEDAFRVRGLDLAESGILAEIHRALCPADERPSEAELYALNVLFLPAGGTLGISCVHLSRRCRGSCGLPKRCRWPRPRG